MNTLNKKVNIPVDFMKLSCTLDNVCCVYPSWRRTTTQLCNVTDEFSVFLSQQVFSLSAFELLKKDKVEYYKETS